MKAGEYFGTFAGNQNEIGVEEREVDARKGKEKPRDLAWESRSSVQLLCCGTEIKVPCHLIKLWAESYSGIPQRSRRIPPRENL
jgi:hypothetical protein